MSLKEKVKNLSKKEKDYVLVSGILGDGCLLGHWIYHTHTTPQRDYVKFKEQLFRCLNLEVKTQYDFKRNTNFGEFTYSMVAVKPKKLSRLKDKDLKYYLKRLTPLSLMLWWLDDGSLIIHHKKNGTSVSRFGYLNTHSFDYQQHKLMVNFFKESYNIDLRVHKDTSTLNKQGKYFRLYFNATALRKLIDLVREWIEFIPESMKYKFNMKYFPTRNKNSKLFQEMYNFGTPV